MATTSEVGIAALLCFGGGDARCGEYRAQLIRLVEKFTSRLAGGHSGLHEYLEPKRGFIRLFQCDIDTSNELRARPGTAGCSIIRADASARPTQLTANVPLFIGSRQRPDESQDVQGELLRTVSERFRFWIHARQHLQTGCR